MNYFDYNSTCPLLPAAHEAWAAAAGKYWANPSSASQPASAARVFLSECREAWAVHFACRPENIVFTAGTTEASNAVLSWTERNANRDARLLLSPFEHPAVLEPAQALFPNRLDFMPLDARGVIDLQAVEEQLRAKPYALVGLMAANNESGLLQPLSELALLCQTLGILILCDAAQWIGKLPSSELPAVDYLTVSGHKFGGPRGTGVLVLSDAAAGFRGRIGGGQEHGHHAGTENLEGIAAITAAIAAQPAAGWPRENLDAFLKTLSGSAFRIIGEDLPRLPNTLSLLIPRHKATRWLPRLEKHGFIVSSGAACATTKVGPSHVMKALGLTDDESSRVIRISSGPETDEAAWLGLRGALDAVLAELDLDDDSGDLVTVIDPDAL
tara:strand:- start:16722 stop:17873 length:1152 start_codon:yes stop_codon:yes gene_type:complete